MNIILTNNKLEIEDASPEVKVFVKTNLSYTDKAKAYQLKRMAKNPWQRNSPLYKQIQQSVHGEVFEESGSKLTMASGFIDLLVQEFPLLNFSDLRNETGHKIVLPWIKKPYTPRDYQEEVIVMCLNSANWRGIVNFATGLGKTLTAIHLIQRYKKNVLIVCPTDSIAKQFYSQCVSAFGPNKVAFYGGGKKKIADITIGIVGSVTRNIDLFKEENFGLVIYDEIHHIAADTFYNIAEGLSGVGKVLGLTATDYRSDGKDIMITAGCGSVIVRRDIKWGIENKYLAEPYFIVREVNTGGQDFKGNKLKNYKEHVLNNQIMKDQIKNDAQAMMKSGKTVLVLVDEVEHGKELSQQLGVPFATGADNKSQDYVDLLNSGKIGGLIGTDGKVGEGTDTQNVDVLILANFVASKGPVVQAIGRGLRLTKTKTRCIVLDYIPLGSDQLTRHAWGRVDIYQEITDKVKVYTSP